MGERLTWHDSRVSRRSAAESPGQKQEYGKLADDIAAVQQGSELRPTGATGVLGYTAVGLQGCRAATGRTGGFWEYERDMAVVRPCASMLTSCWRSTTSCWRCVGGMVHEGGGHLRWHILVCGIPSRVRATLVCMLQEAKMIHGSARERAKTHESDKEVGVPLDTGLDNAGCFLHRAPSRHAVAQPL